jgi:hypothetical protein
MSPFDSEVKWSCIYLKELLWKGCELNYAQCLWYLCKKVSVKKYFYDQGTSGNISLF